MCVCVSSTCRSDRVLCACININNPHEYLMNANEADLNHSISVFMQMKCCVDCMCFLSVFKYI